MRYQEFRAGQLLQSLPFRWSACARKLAGVSSVLA